VERWPANQMAAGRVWGLGFLLVEGSNGNLTYYFIKSVFICENLCPKKYIIYIDRKI
jgi:hypothetical protein